MGVFPHYDFRIIKRSVALGHIAENHRTLGYRRDTRQNPPLPFSPHILQSSGEGCNASWEVYQRNYSINLLLSRNPALVAEADEFDRFIPFSFPEFALITPLTRPPGYLRTPAAVKEAFSQFASQIIPGGTLILNTSGPAAQTAGQCIGLPLRGECALRLLCRQLPCGKKMEHVISLTFQRRMQPIAPGNPAG
jgi:hypothetical protein